MAESGYVGGTVPRSAAPRKPVPWFGVAERCLPAAASLRSPRPHPAPARRAHLAGTWLPLQNAAGAAGVGLRGRRRARPVWDGEESASFSRETASPAGVWAGPGARERPRTPGERTFLLTF